MRPANKGIEENLFNKLIEINEKTPFHKLMGVFIIEIGKGFAMTGVKIEEKHLNPLNIAHGGVLFTLMDITMGMAARTLGKQVISIEMNINYIAPANIGDEVKATAKMLHVGNKTSVAVCEAYSQDGKLLASARETFFNV
ncbi:MAG: PaaI family thioesterase [Thermoanaerobacteraceae bacterium]